MQDLPLRVTDRSMTVIDRDNGHEVATAVEWKDLGRYEDWLVERLLSPTAGPADRRGTRDDDGKGPTSSAAPIRAKRALASRPAAQ